MNTAHVRTYCSGVRVGNWNEDIALEEEILKDFLAKRDRGELLSQRTGGILDAVTSKATLSVSRDGKIHFGDIVVIVNLEPRDCSRKAHGLCMTISQEAVYGDKESLCSPVQETTASTDITPKARNCFVVASCDGSHEGEPLRYNQPFYLRTADGSNLYLHCDRATLNNVSKLSRHSRVKLYREPSHFTEWRVLPFNPQFRMELEYSPAPANSKLIINHVKTNLNLCLETFDVRTPFGKEKEVTCHTSLDSHRAENDNNHWVIMLQVPGDDVMCVDAPNPARTGCEPLCGF